MCEYANYVLGNSVIVFSQRFVMVVLSLTTIKKCCLTKLPALRG